MNRVVGLTVLIILTTTFHISHGRKYADEGQIEPEHDGERLYSEKRSDEDDEEEEEEIAEYAFDLHNQPKHQRDLAPDVNNARDGTLSREKRRFGGRFRGFGGGFGGGGGRRFPSFRLPSSASFRRPAARPAVSIKSSNRPSIGGNRPAANVRPPPAHEPAGGMKQTESSQQGGYHNPIPNSNFNPNSNPGAYSTPNNRPPSGPQGGPPNGGASAGNRKPGGIMPIPIPIPIPLPHILANSSC